MNRKQMLIVAILLLAAAGGVGYFAWSRRAPEQTQPEPGQDDTSAAEPEPDPSAPPDVEEDIAAEEEKLKSSEMVSEEAVRERKKKTGYIHDPKVPGGAVKGFCYVKHDKDVRLYPPFPIEIEGENAIKKPRKGEVEYYESRKPMPIVHLNRYSSKEKRYGVKGAAIMVHDVQAGPRRNFDRLRYQIDFRNHRLVPARPEGRDVFNPSAYDVGVMRTKQLVQVLNLSTYDSYLTLTNVATGKVRWDQALPGYNDPNFPGHHLGYSPVMKRPEVYQVPRIEQRGIYKFRCKRHPWQEAYLVLWDNPYVDVSRAGDRRYPESAGEFGIGGIPEGTYKVEVWHPKFEPVKRMHEVEIAVDRTTPLSVEFKKPPVLEEKPQPLPNKLITRWAFIGPFYPLMDEEPDAPNNNLDFDSSYDGMEERVRWKYLNVSKGRRPGYVHLHKATWRIRTLSLSYLALRINSPKAQKVYFAIDNETDSLKMWLNNKVIFHSYTGDFGRGGRYPGWFINTAELKKGQNTLLILVSAENTERAAFAMKYRAEGATIEVPVRNVEPRGSKVEAECKEGRQAKIQLPIEDEDHALREQKLKAVVTKQPRHGTLERQDDTTFIYHSKPGYPGKDAFTWVPDDGRDKGKPVEATVSISPDKSAPALTRVAPGGEGKTIRVHFDEPLAARPAADASNWSVSSGVKVNKAVLTDDGCTVVLHTSSLSQSTKTYKLAGKSVKDRSRAANATRCSVSFRAMQPGLRYVYYKGTPKGDDLKHFDAMKPKHTGTAAQIGLTEKMKTDSPSFSIRFQGKIKIPADGTYTFYTTSDDGSRLYIDGHAVVKNDGGHGAREMSGKKKLAAGLHDITVTYYQGGAGLCLTAAWEGPDIKKQPIPADTLQHVPQPTRASRQPDNSKNGDA
jgi:hypothetical protein